MERASSLDTNSARTEDTMLDTTTDTRLARAEDTMLDTTTDTRLARAEDTMTATVMARRMGSFWARGKDGLTDSMLARRRCSCRDISSMQKKSMRTEGKARIKVPDPMVTLG
jgi:hypothetical protein